MPDARTYGHGILERADLMDTKLGQVEKSDPSDVARQGFDAMVKGQESVVVGWSNKLQVAMSRITSLSRLAEKHRKRTQPGTGKEA